MRSIYRRGLLTLHGNLSHLKFEAMAETMLATDDFYVDFGGKQVRYRIVSINSAKNTAIIAPAIDCDALSLASAFRPTDLA